MDSPHLSVTTLHIQYVSKVNLQLFPHTHADSLLMTGNKGCVNTSVGAELPDSKRPSLLVVKLWAIRLSTEHPLSDLCPRFEPQPTMTIQLLNRHQFVFVCLFCVFCGNSFEVYPSVRMPPSLFCVLSLCFYHFTLMLGQRKSQWQIIWRHKNPTKKLFSKVQKKM